APQYITPPKNERRLPPPSRRCLLPPSSRSFLPPSSFLRGGSASALASLRRDGRVSSAAAARCLRLPEARRAGFSSSAGAARSRADRRRLNPGIGNMSTLGSWRPVAFRRRCPMRVRPMDRAGAAGATPLPQSKWEPFKAGLNGRTGLGRDPAKAANRLFSTPRQPAFSSRAASTLLGPNDFPLHHH